MPVYEFKCKKCGHTWEKEQSYTDKPPSRCPSNGCRGQVTRVFSPPAIVFKGKGWHVNDYKRSGGPKKSAPQPEKCPAAASCSSGTCPAAGGD